MHLLSSLMKEKYVAFKSIVAEGQETVAGNKELKSGEIIRLLLGRLLEEEPSLLHALSADLQKQIRLNISTDPNPVTKHNYTYFDPNSKMIVQCHNVSLSHTNIPHIPSLLISVTGLSIIKCALT